MVFTIKKQKTSENKEKKWSWEEFDKTYGRLQTHAGKIIQVALRAVELLAVLLTLVVLLVTLALDVGFWIFGSGSYPDLDGFLHAMLTVVVGLEFVHTILAPTPVSILDVLIAAIARHFILGREEPITCIVCVASIAGLYAIRRFLLPKKEAVPQAAIGQEAGAPQSAACEAPQPAAPAEDIAAGQSVPVEDTPAPVEESAEEEPAII